MTVATHLLATALGVQLLHLKGAEVALAYAFGVGVDLDHLIKAPFYLRAVGLKNRRGYYWRSSLQEPVALLWILPLCWLLETWIPAGFFLLHLALDYSVSYEKLPWYPYAPRVVRGWGLRVGDGTKEAVVFSLLATSNLLLLWLKR